MLVSKEHKQDHTFDFKALHLGQATIIHADCFDWMNQVPENSIDAVVTDPPYGVKEFEIDQIEKMHLGETGIWRIPPSFDGHKRAPLPRFTALDQKEREVLRCFFREWSEHIYRILKPGAHVFVASNSFISQLTFSSIIEGGLEFRTEIIRLVQTLRGGDRPKLAEDEFSDVTVLPRGGYEPWGLFRKPIPKGMTVRECLREYGTGGLRRLSVSKPFSDVIISERTPKRERVIANHPSLKPQSFMRQIVHAALPLGTGTILDPFMGAGSTIAAAEHIGYQSIGIERYNDYFEVASNAIEPLKLIQTHRKKYL